MLTSIKHYALRGLSAVGALAMFVIMLPLTLAAMLIMTLAGIIALANIRHRLREAQQQAQWQTVDDVSSAKQTASVKPPIEGSYTVVSE